MYWIINLVIYWFIAKVYYEYDYMANYENDYKAIIKGKGRITQSEEESLQVYYLMSAIFWAVVMPCSILGKIAKKIAKILFKLNGE